MNNILTIFFITLISILLASCGKKDRSSLPDECKSMFEQWDVYIDKLDIDPAVPDYYVEAQREQQDLELRSIFLLKDHYKQLNECKTYSRITQMLMNDYKSDPQQLYKDILQSDAAKKARGNK